MEEKHFFVVHTFVSDEARKEFLTAPEKRSPPEKRKTEETDRKELERPMGRTSQMRLGKGADGW